MEKITLQIQQTKSNFEWFTYIINNIIDELFDDNKYKERIELEKEVLSLISQWYENIEEENNISKEIFSEKK